jgi:hypothetical protein
VDRYDLKRPFANLCKILLFQVAKSRELQNSHLCIWSPQASKDDVETCGEEVSVHLHHDGGCRRSEQGGLVEGLLAYGCPAWLDAKSALKPVLEKLYCGFFFLWQTVRGQSI